MIKMNMENNQWQLAWVDFAPLKEIGGHKNNPIYHLWTSMMVIN